MAKKNVYKSDLEHIKELRQARNPELFADYLVNKAKQVNQRLYRLEKSGKGLNDTAYTFAQIETNKEKPRYSTSKNYYLSLAEKSINNETGEVSVNVSSLYEKALELNAKITSKTSTITGLQEVKNNRLVGSKKQLENLGVNFDEVSDDEFDDFLRNGGGELMNKYDSTQIVDDWLEMRKEGVTTDRFINTYKDYLKDAEHKKEIDYEYIQKKFKRVINNKKKKSKPRWKTVKKQRKHKGRKGGR